MKRFKTMNLFELLSMFDWISPLLAMGDDIRHGGLVNLNAWTFYIPNADAINRGWSGDHIEYMLRQHGIETWSRLVNFGEYSFCVSLSQAAQAEQLLNQYGIPIKPRSAGAPGRLW